VIFVAQLLRLCLNNNVALNVSNTPADSPLAAPNWQAISADSKHLYGNLATLGVNFVWHDFKLTKPPLDWAAGFQPRSIGICLNILGNAVVSSNSTCAEFKERTGGFYCNGAARLVAHRNPDQQHQFITIEFTRAYLKQHLGDNQTALHPLIAAALEKSKLTSGVSTPAPLNNRQQQLLSSLRHPPLIQAAQFLWYQSKALELMIEFFFQVPSGEDFFCVRQKAVAQERVRKVMAILSQKLADPPALEEIARTVGCSHFYLSRTFSTETGMTISQYLRQIRMEKAAELLKTGKFNVTEVAIEVGYNSLGHFSKSFHETFGCCPGLYSLAPKHNKL
jgi:AraC-like DNA-binding protein